MTDDRPQNFSWLPAILAEIADVAGLDAAIAIARSRGGTSVHIPAKPRPGHWLIETVGEPAARLICKHFAVRRGGVTIMLPLGPTGTMSEARERIDRMIAEGKSTSEIARAAGYTTRGVERRKARARQRSRQRQETLF